MLTPLRLGSVLVVDDDLLLLEVMAAVLRDNDYEVLVANTGVTAIEVLERAAHVLLAVITDIDLGSGWSGWNLGRLARRLNPALSVIYMSGESRGDWASEGVPNSVMLAKPLAPAAVLNALASSRSPRRKLDS